MALRPDLDTSISSYMPQCVCACHWKHWQDALALQQAATTLKTELMRPGQFMAAQGHYANVSAALSGVQAQHDGRALHWHAQGPRQGACATVARAGDLSSNLKATH